VIVWFAVASGDLRMPHHIPSSAVIAGQFGAKCLGVDFLPKDQFGFVGEGSQSVLLDKRSRLFLSPGEPLAKCLEIWSPGVYIIHGRFPFVGPRSEPSSQHSGVFFFSTHNIVHPPTISQQNLAPHLGTDYNDDRLLPTTTKDKEMETKPRNTLNSLEYGQLAIWIMAHTEWIADQGSWQTIAEKATKDLGFPVSRLNMKGYCPKLGVTISEEAARETVSSKMWRHMRQLESRMAALEGAK
jgi:hypothetical protein